MKILCAYIRMLGAQIEKLPVSVGNSSGRIETSTVLSLGAYLGLVVLILDSYLSLCRLVLAY